MLNDSEKLEVLKVANVFVLPSPSEGLSIALLEALNMNLPVNITTGVGLNKSIRSNNAGLIIDYDQEQLTEAILLMNSEKILTMVGKGKELINKGFTWDRIAKQFIEEVSPILKTR